MILQSQIVTSIVTLARQIGEGGIVLKPFHIVMPITKYICGDVWKKNFQVKNCWKGINTD